MRYVSGRSVRKFRLTTRLQQFCTMKRSKRSKPNIYVDVEVYPDTSDEEDSRPCKMFHHHTTATVSNAGTKIATSAIFGPPSPTKATTHASLTDIIHDQGADFDSEQFEFFQDGHFEAWDTEHELTRQRLRTRSVSCISHTSGRKLTDIGLRMTQ